VCEVLGIPFRETHRAEADARAAAEVARRLVVREAAVADSQSTAQPRPDSQLGSAAACAPPRDQPSTLRSGLPGG